MPVTQIMSVVGRNSSPPPPPSPTAYATYGASPTEGYGTDITVTVENWTGARLYWTVVGKGSPAADPATDMTGQLSGFWDPGNVTYSTSVVTTVSFVADTTTEGTEYWGVDLGSTEGGQQYFAGNAWSITDASITAPQPPFSLEFNQPQGDYLSTPGNADWNLGTTGTIEFWLNANNSSSANINIPGGQWGLINQGGWYYGMPNNSSILIGLASGKLSIAQSNTDDVKFAEPTPGVWTHVAVVYDSGTQKVFYNGVEQTKTDGNYLGNGWTNSTSDLYIGRLAPSYQSHFDGKMALVRISNTAKYVTAFTPTATYGVEADTVLFLGTNNPLVDDKDHTITNNGTALSNDVPGAFAPLSLQLVQSQTDYLDVAASSDWALSRTWTIEFWSKASKVSTEGDLLTVMCQDYTDGNSIQIIYQGGSFEIQGTNRIAAEPSIGGVPTTLFNVNSQGGWNGGGAWTNLSTTGGTGTGLTVSVAGVGGGYVNALSIVTPGSGYTSGDVITAVGESSVSFTIGSCTPIGVWTHVALVNTVADGMTLYYNGVSQYTGGYWSLANNTAPIRIGARGTAEFQRFDGLLALIRISNTAKYTGNFIVSNSYGVEADTKLFLGGAVPFIDAKGHAVTNHGVTPSTDFPAVVDTKQSLGVTWTVEIVAELDFQQAWATLWGNESWDAGLGHLAYMNGTNTLVVGAPNAGDQYTLADPVSTRAHWVFSHLDGSGVDVYRNGVLLTPDSTGYSQPTPASNTLILGARHLNDGTGTADYLAGNYLYTNIRNTALDAAGVTSAYNALKTAYGLP